MSSNREFHANQPGHMVFIGWDNPMMTYFAKVWREPDPAIPDDEGEELIWLGSQSRDIATPEVLVEPLAAWFTVTPDLIEQLKADRRADLDRGPSALQRHMGAMFDQKTQKS